jgi:hypothetical protein
MHSLIFMHKKQGNLLKGIDKKTGRREGIELVLFLVTNMYI